MNKAKATEILSKCRISFKENFDCEIDETQLTTVLEKSLEAKKGSWLNSYLCDRNPEELKAILLAQLESKEQITVVNIAQKETVVSLPQKDAAKVEAAEAKVEKILASKKKKKSKKKK